MMEIVSFGLWSRIAGWVITKSFLTVSKDDIGPSSVRDNPVGVLV